MDMFILIWGHLSGVVTTNRSGCPRMIRSISCGHKLRGLNVWIGEGISKIASTRSTTVGFMLNRLNPDYRGLCTYLWSYTLSCVCTFFPTNIYPSPCFTSQLHWYGTARDAQPTAANMSIVSYWGRAPPPMLLFLWLRWVLNRWWPSWLLLPQWWFSVAGCCFM